MSNVYLIILCGGFGERLWPISRREKPKPFVPFLGEKSLIELTIERIKNLNSIENIKIGVVTHKDQKERIKKLIGKDIDFIIEEDDSRNTAPAVLYSLFKIYEKDPDGIVVYLPADSFVVETEKYVKILNTAIEYTKTNNKIVTVGVMPTNPSTSYGYIQAKAPDNFIIANNVYCVEKFHEKPDLKTANSYLKNNFMLWNISVFASKVNFFIEEFKIHTPNIYHQMLDYLNHKISYFDVENKSIDFAVIEKSQNIAVIPADFNWCDVGNIDVFLNLQNKLSQKSQNIFNISGENNLVFQNNKEKIVTFVGVSDLCVVDTDDVLMVVKNSEVEKIKELLNVIKKTEKQKFL
ncbi:hypothetical protein KJ644_03110 [Candidatus Dependentiae bacterium]|nr:hypothetical protein [Candidatus Dependentiae bacterium]MBU4387435.1 hypothetical protein [Candidatus Dependentiae bacterium]